MEAEDISEEVRPGRVLFIDVMKGMLVIGMVMGHVVKILGEEGPFGPNVLAWNADLASFPGFLLSFGFASQLAYYRQEGPIPYRRILRGAAKILVAFYVSGIAYRVLLDGESFSAAVVGRILTISDIPSYSEFLLTFALVTLLAALLARPLRAILSDSARFGAVLAVLLLTTFIPVDGITNPQLGLLLGTRRFTVFPVLPYLPMFLIGMYFARHGIRIGRPWFLAALAGLVVFAGVAALAGMPSRFPPSMVWILGSYAFAYVYYLGAQVVSQFERPAALLAAIGRNVLFYLLGSNLLLFAARLRFPEIQLGLAASLLVGIGMLILIGYLSALVTPRPRAVAAELAISR